MTAYDEIEIEDMEWNEELRAFTFACPCGDVFQITKEELAMGEDVARCPSCSLHLHVVFDPADFAEFLPGATKQASEVAVVSVA